MKRSIYSITLLVFFLFILVGCATKENNPENDMKEQPSITEESVPEYSEPEQKTSEITIAAIGDILIHDRVYNDAKTDNGFDFMPMLENVKPIFQDSTITIANQETMIGGEEIGLSGYPRFNSPVEVGDMLKEAGVDIVSLANNHTLDHGETAIQKAIQYWDKLKMPYVGAYKNNEDKQKQRIINTNDISVGFLSYTYGTNGIPVPKGKGYLVNLINREKISDDMETMKEKVDVVIISLHFGNEYERMPSNDQKDLVQFVADEGADVVLGHHPHVLQPVEWVKSENDGKDTLVIYSLGNFLSGQKEIYQKIGGVLKFTVHKTNSKDESEATIEINTPQFIPTFNASEDENNYRVLPMYNVTEETLPNADKHYEEIQKHMNQWVPELEFPEP